jgi:hypothetical protein
MIQRSIEIDMMVLHSYLLTTRSLHVFSYAAADVAGLHVLMLSSRKRSW